MASLPKIQQMSVPTTVPTTMPMTTPMTMNRGHTERRRCARHRAAIPGSFAFMVFVASVFVSSAAVADKESNAGIHEPLSAAEIDAAVRAAPSQGQNLKSSSVLANGTTSRASLSSIGDELLLVERRVSKTKQPSGDRVAVVYRYDYGRNVLKEQTVDLHDNTVIDSTEYQGVQLPLTPAEVQRAFDIVLADQAYLADLQHVYRNVTGEAFSVPSQVHYKAFVFHAETVQRGLMPKAQDCGLHRCVQLVVYTTDNVSLAFAPIVDLSRGEVVQNLEQRLTLLPSRGGPGKHADPTHARPATRTGQ